VIFSTDLPVELPSNGTVLLVPSETATATLAALQSRYPDGTLTVRRDHRANVLLYHYRVAPKSP
jgi:hypothetical protein